VRTHTGPISVEAGKLAERGEPGGEVRRWPLRVRTGARLIAIANAGSSVITEVSMLNWISRWAMRHAPTPEKTAASMLVTARMELFTAEQRVIDAKLQADYWRTRVAFLEEVQKQGIDPWVSAQSSLRPEVESSPRGTGPRLAAST
jgi:hypothetical protein